MSQDTAEAAAKPIPFDITQEQAILSCCLINPLIISGVGEVIQPADLFRKDHEKFFQVMLQLKDQLTPETLAAEVPGKEAYIAVLCDAVSTSAGWNYHAQAVKRLATKRLSAELFSEAERKMRNGSGEPIEILAEVKTGIRAIEATQEQGYKDSLAAVNETFRDIEHRKENQDQHLGPPTGFRNIDTYIDALENQTTTYLIARPSIGKTALSLNIAENVAKADGDDGKVLFISLESNVAAITRRRIAAASEVYLTRLRTGDIEQSQWRFLIDACNKLSSSRMLIADHPRFRMVENLISFCSSIAVKYKISLIVIDHLQKMDTTQRTSSRHDRFSIVSDSLQDMAKELGPPVLVNCQLSRKIEDRPRKQQMPRLDDIRESGTIEENADGVWSLYRKDKKDDLARIEGLKGRDIGTWKTTLKFDRHIQRFSDTQEQYVFGSDDDDGL